MFRGITDLYHDSDILPDNRPHQVSAQGTSSSPFAPADLYPPFAHPTRPLTATWKGYNEHNEDVYHDSEFGHHINMRGERQTDFTPWRVQQPAR